METLYILVPYQFMICINVDERQGGAGTYFCRAMQQSWIILAMIPALSHAAKTP